MVNKAKRCPGCLLLGILTTRALKTVAAINKSSNLQIVVYLRFLSKLWIYIVSLLKSGKLPFCLEIGIGKDSVCTQFLTTWNRNWGIMSGRSHLSCTVTATRQSLGTGVLETKICRFTYISGTKSIFGTVQFRNRPLSMNDWKIAFQKKISTDQHV